ncbi:MAG: HAD family hydrolase [Chloroflexota bacterium]
MGAGCPVKAVFLDLYNTLARIYPPREVIQARAASPFGLQLTKEDVDAGYALADAKMAEQSALGPVNHLPEEERRRFFAEYEQLILKGAGHDVDLETAERIWRAVRQQEYGMALFDDALPCLDSLRTGDPPRVVGVLTNLDRTGDELAHEIGFYDHVDFTLTSEQVGEGKPNRAMFDAALRLAGARACEAVHVGDQITTDVEGALAAGLRAVLIDRYGDNPDYDACPRIATLSELPAVIKAL